jgi:hypothetical protein
MRHAVGIGWQDVGSKIQYSTHEHDGNMVNNLKHWIM